MNSKFVETVLALAFTAACAALVFGFTRLVYGDSAIGWITRGAWALWRMVGFVCVLGLIAAGAVDAHAQTRVLRGDSDRVDLVTPHGIWTGVGETPRQGNEIKGNFIGPDGSLRHCILHTDGQGNVLLSECP